MTVSMIEEALQSILTSDTAVKAITAQCYPGTLPQDPFFPLILYMRITGIPDNLLYGTSGKCYSRFQIEAWALTYSGAKALSNAIRNAINAKSFAVGSVSIGSIVMQSERDFYEEFVKCHRIIQDYTLWHTEP